MNYQMSVIGVAIILVYSALVLLFIVWPLSRMLRKFRWKWKVLGPIAFTLLAAPWAEEYWIASNFHEACQDAGVHVYKKVEVEGFYDGTSNWGQQGFLQVPYQFIEFKSSFNPGYKRLEKIGGSVQVTSLGHPTARYHYKYAYQPTPYIQEERIGWKLEKLGTVVVDSETGEIIARDTQYRRTINIAEGSWRLFWGLAKTTCEGTAPKPPDLRYPLYHYVLIPAKH